jgi:hypothetical protein
LETQVNHDGVVWSRDVTVCVAIVRASDENVVWAAADVECVLCYPIGGHVLEEIGDDADIVKCSIRKRIDVETFAHGCEEEWIGFENLLRRFLIR